MHPLRIFLGVTSRLGGRLPSGSNSLYDRAADTWEVLPNLPTQRNHFTGAAINGRIH